MRNKIITKRLRIISIILIIAALTGLSASLIMRDKIKSDTREEVFSNALQEVDSILSVYDSDPEEYARFKESCSNLPLGELEQECYRAASANNSERKEEMLCRAVTQRYDKDMPDADKTKIIKILNNLGYSYINNQNYIAAYMILKTALEMGKYYDANRLTEAVLITNIAFIFEQFNDINYANKLYTQAFDIAFDKNYNPGTARHLEYIRIHSIIEYAIFAWTTGMVDSLPSKCEVFQMMVPSSTYEDFNYAKFMCEASKSYSGRDYIKAASLLDSAFYALNPYDKEHTYLVHSKLMKSDALFQAKDYQNMRKELDKADSIIKTKGINELTLNLKKKEIQYYRAIGDSVPQEIIDDVLSYDSIYNNRNYATIRDIEAQWNINSYNIEIGSSKHYSILAIIFATVLGLSVIGTAIIFLIIKRNAPDNNDSYSTAETLRKIESGSDNIATGNIASDKIEPDNITADDITANGTETVDTEIDDTEAVNTETVRCSESIETSHITEDENNVSQKVDADMQKLYKYLQNAIAASPNIYNIDFSIDSLAEETGISSRRISQTVNACSGKNFSRLVAEYRVKEACRILRDAKTPLLRPTMDALAQMVGYKSRTHLTRVFKTELGITPAEYLASLPLY